MFTLPKSFYSPKTTIVLDTSWKDRRGGDGTPRSINFLVLRSSMLCAGRVWGRDPTVLIIKVFCLLIPYKIFRKLPCKDLLYDA